MAEPGLRMEGVTVRRGGLVILDDVSVSCGPGLVALEGRNGAGKSTMLLAAAGIKPPARGLIAIDGLDLAKHPVQARRRLGFMPQGADLFPYLSGRELIETVAGLRGSVARALDLADALVGRSTLDLPMGVLSIGQRRKLALAAALTGAPSLLLLDEPADAFDLVALDALALLLEQHRGSGGTAVIATHAPERLGVAWDGRFVVERQAVHPCDRP